MAHNPYTNHVALHIVEEMVGKSFEITSPQATGIKVEELRIALDFANAYLKFSKKVFAQRVSDGIIFFKNLVQITLNAAMESSLHGALNRTLSDQM